MTIEYIKGYLEGRIEELDDRDNNYADIQKHTLKEVLIFINNKEENPKKGL